jgi:RNA polymerase sigma-70 factor, ECF subfamily
MDHFRQPERDESSVDQLHQLRAREDALAALVVRAAKGDQTALAALYDETSALVYGLALRILRDQHAAEDVTIDVYAQVYRQVSSYDATRGTPSAWLMTLTTLTRHPRARRLVPSHGTDRKQTALLTPPFRPRTAVAPQEQLIAQWNAVERGLDTHGRMEEERT